MASRATQYRPVAPAQADARRAPRHRVVVTRASVRRHGAAAVEAVLDDLSIYGCRVSVAELDPVGERLWLRFEGGMPVAATVIWATDGRMGCRFDQPIARQLARALTLAFD
ncbi:PilZ domain-containing protein [Sphingomonas japonica]|uniref:PilZ domain-containing protein n=1 Tax=Sphingomonas japonica TaxID=511662 RepID=A0ABX0U1M7_9SPHN|nr:PilZ domain-containing protein [Sphingomonas japonica]NIJ23246.1 hypothetical protein [Sphingomonas japonica]